MHDGDTSARDAQPEAGRGVDPEGSPESADPAGSGVPADSGASAETAAPAEGAAPSEPGAVEQAMETLTQSWLGWLGAYPWAQLLIMLSLLLAVAWFAHLLVKRHLLRLATHAMNRLPKWWAGVVTERKVLHRLVPLVPTIIITRGIVLVPHLPAGVVEMVQRLGHAAGILFTALALGALLGAVNQIYNRYPIAQGRPIKGYLQVVKLVAYIAAGILMLASLMAESPWVFMTGLGAMMAVVLLIFRDTLLSLVAGIQLVNNDLVRVGDWIEMPQFNADGNVMDISLHVVQVRNWDKTITSIPTHKFLEHAFKNWRGMVEVGGRRVKRPVHIDMTTIRFLTEEEIGKFSRFHLLREYIAAKTEEIDAYNRTHCADENGEIIVNARHLTNIGTFRAYIFEYLKNHPLVNQEMTMLVRQLDSGPHGLPLEVWCYLKDTRWPFYERAQSDIFDHILSVTGEFGLRVFQEPTGNDVAQLRFRHRSDTETETAETGDRRVPPSSE